jgi:hypothetical protein
MTADTQLGRPLYCAHGVPLHNECTGCQLDARSSDDAPEHGPCTWNCGSPSCDAPEYPKGDDA